MLKMLNPTSKPLATTLMAMSGLPGLGVRASETLLALTGGADCHGKVCHPVEQYCSHFEQVCTNCSWACLPGHSNYDPTVCSRECSDYIKLQPLKNEIHQIQMQQNIILYLLVLLLLITFIHFTWKCLKWLQYKRCITHMLKKMHLRKESLHMTTKNVNGKDAGLGGGMTIQNTCAINDMERATSHSLTGAEGSVRTVTTPISSRYPAENTTPSPQPNEYSYDNQALAVTPVSEKPGGPGSTF